jgi:carbon storage regulator
MLVLLRRKNESVVINNDITVTVVEIRDDNVRLGFVAPKEVPIHRQETWDAIQSQTGQSFPPVQLTFPKAPPLGDPWRPHLEKSDPASAESNERRAGFLGRLAQQLKEKSGKDVNLASVAQTLIDGIYYSDVDLSPADSLDQLKQLLVQCLKRPS